jgi:flagellum-specific peptidoglycan hydrolase FlgJ
MVLFLTIHFATMGGIRRILSPRFSSAHHFSLYSQQYSPLMRRLYILCLLLLVVFSSCHRKLHRQQRAARNKITTEEYIATYKKIARKEMKRNGIPASITLAQGILESGSGNSELARRARNHFGIKCTSDWQGKTYHVDDDRPNECFRRYRHVEHSFHDHSEFLKKKRYSQLFELDRDDYKGWAKGLKRAGYATNPKYPQLLINLIEKHKLYKYD